MTCKDCIHGELCISRTDTVWFNKTEYRDLDDVEKVCEDFKNKADFVKIPCRCVQCQYSFYIGNKDKYECRKHNGCLKYPGDYCSSGDKRMVCK